MKRALSRIWAPIAARLPDLRAVPRRKQIAGGLLFSVLLHVGLLVVLLLGAWIFPERAEVALVPPPPPKVEEALIEMEIVVVKAPEPAIPQEPPVIDPKGLAKADAAPDRPVFQSSQDMLAGSEKPATGSVPLPSQDGVDHPAIEFKNQAASFGKNAEPAETPAAMPSEPPPSPPVPKPIEPKASMPNENEVPLYPKPVATPPPRLALMTTPAPRPQPPRESASTPEMRATRIEGSISNRRRPGVDAVRTPLGVYQQRLSAQVQARWQYYTRQQSDMLALGTARVRFFVNRDGKVQGVQVISNDSNSAFANICEQSIREADMPAPPSDLEAMKDGRLELFFSFTLYSTR
jgi:outer membrane biosynthesis protein TonB